MFTIWYSCAPTWYGWDSSYINKPNSMFTAWLFYPRTMSNHMQESTTFSLTDTVVGRHDGHERPHLASAFSENNVPSPTCVDSVEDPRKHNTESAKSAYESETSTIPSRREFPSRTLIVCFDGTGDQFDKDNSNVVKFVSLLKKGVTTEQMVYYQVRLTDTAIHWFWWLVVLILHLFFYSRV